MKKFLPVFCFCIIFSLRLKSQCIFTNNSYPQTCHESCDASAEVDANPNDNYLWSTGATTNTVSNLCAGTYTCSVTDSVGNPLCTCPFTISQPLGIGSYDLFYDSIINAPCATGKGYIFVEAEPGGNLNYSMDYGIYGGVYWIRADDNWIEIANSPDPGFPPGYYTVIITAVTCPTDSYELTCYIGSNSSPLAVSDSIVPAVCPGGWGDFFLNVTNGDGYYSFNFGSYYSAGTPGLNSLQVPTGTYPVTVYEDNCANDSANIVVNVTDNLTTVITYTDSIIFATSCTPCNGAYFISPSGGTTPYNYLWEDSSFYGQYLGMCSGIYPIQIIDANGCTAWDTVVIKNTIDSLSIAATNTGVSCAHGMDTTVVTVTYGAPYFIFNWGDGKVDSGIASPQTHIYTNGGIYSIKVTDSLGCNSLIQNQVIDTGIQINIAQVINPLCTNTNIGKVRVSVSGGRAPYLYLWNTGATADSIVNVPAGNYAVTVSGGGCEAAITYSLSQINQEPGYYVYSSSGFANCSGSNATSAVMVYGGTPPYNYLWNTVPVQNSDTATGLSPGNYTFTVTDSLGCLALGSTEVYAHCVNLIYGNIFNDVNGNCLFDSGDTPIQGAYIIAQQSGQNYYGTSQSNGQYFIELPDTGTYSLLAMISEGNCGYVPLCGNFQQTATFDDLGDTLSNYNFASHGAIGFDLTLHPSWSSASPGFEKTYWVYYYNESQSPFTDTATIVLTFDSNLIYKYSDAPVPVYDGVAHTLTWMVDSFPGSNWVGRLNNYFLVPATLSLDYLLQTKFSITPTAGDCDVSNNFFNFSQVSGGSHDPNEKDVDPAGEVTENDSVLTYTINFQNTGTSATNFIIVKDTLSPYLNPATVFNIASSADYSDFNISGQGILTWTFNPLNLPDSLTDVSGSKGFIMFRVNKESDLALGTIISNTASIYFDYNSPIQTNSAVDSQICVVDTSLYSIVCRNIGFNFNGVQLDSSGTYTDTLTSSSGCDSIVTINLTVLPLSYTNDTEIICQGQSYGGYGVTGVYPDTLTASNGCDSIYTLYLTVLPVLDSTLNISICTGQSYNGYDSTGTYVDTLTGSSGCDSIVTLNLTVNPVYNSTLFDTICPGASFNFNGSQIDSAGTYIDTLTSSTGCDSIVTLNLTILPVSDSSYSVSICEGQSYNGHDATGIYADTLTGSNGCDSIVTLNLTVNNAIITNLPNAATCEGTPYTFNGNPLNTTGTYADTLTSSAGCDSIVVLNLTVNPAYTDSSSDTICAGHTFEGDSLSGIYADTLTSVNGCDSIIILNLIISPNPYPPFIMQSNDTLISSEVASSYQWYLNDSALAGDTSVEIVALQNGNYQLEITGPNNCSTISAYYLYPPTGIQSVNNGLDVKLYPNPNSGSFVVEFSDNTLKEVCITDVLGQVTVANRKVTLKTEFDLSALESGVYFLKITDPQNTNEFVFRQVVVQH